MGKRDQRSVESLSRRPAAGSCLCWLGGLLIALAAIPAAASADELRVSYSPTQPAAGQPLQIVARAFNPNADPQQIDVFIRASHGPCSATVVDEAAAGSARVISATLAPATNTGDHTGSFTPATAGVYAICGYENYVGQTSGTAEVDIAFTVTGSGSGSGSGSSRGSSQQDCVVPGLVGKRLAAAKRALGAAHCGVGTVGLKQTKRAARGRVLSQGLRPGTHRPAGTKVRLLVGR